MSSASTTVALPESAPAQATDTWYPLRRAAETVLAPLIALIGASILFSIFLVCLDRSPLDFLDLVWRGAFGSWFFHAEHVAAGVAAASDRALRRAARPAW